MCARAAPTSGANGRCGSAHRHAPDDSSPACRRLRLRVRAALGNFSVPICSAAAGDHDGQPDIRAVSRSRDWPFGSTLALLVIAVTTVLAGDPGVDPGPRAEVGGPWRVNSGARAIACWAPARLVYAFLYAPILVLMCARSTDRAARPRGAGSRPSGYRELFDSQDLLDSLKNTVFVATVVHSDSAALAMGLERTVSAFSIGGVPARRRARHRPGDRVAVLLHADRRATGCGQVIAAHVVFDMIFVAIVRTRLGFIRPIDRGGGAAWAPVAGPRSSGSRCPAPGIAAGASVAFTLSLPNEFIIAFFTSGPTCSRGPCTRGSGSA